jgi:Raf kinase inhibitor-like YbhB/YbcL family protein
MFHEDMRSCALVGLTAPLRATLSRAARFGTAMFGTAMFGAGLLGLVACGHDTPTVAAPSSSTLTVTSSAFRDGGNLPVQYTCKGNGEVPPIAWSGSAAGAAAFAVVVDDPDAPGGTFVHRIVLDLPGGTTRLDSGTPGGAHEAKNSSGKTGWTPPCPPSGTHHYRFTVYGLSAPTGLPDGTPTDDALKAVSAKAVTQGRLTGLVSH